MNFHIYDANQQHPDNSPKNSDPIIEFKSINKRYTDTSEMVLNDVNLQVFQGEFITIIGPSGSGKSTLLNILGLLDTPTSGEYLLDGQELSRVKGKSLDEIRGRYLGFVFQDAHLLPYESVLRNTSLPLRVQGVPYSRQGEITENRLQEVGLAHRLESRGRDLSGGERQRVAIARALASQPQILLADEPTGNLDQLTTKKIMEELKTLNSLGVTIILITHDQNVAEQGSRCLRMNQGKLEEVFSKPGFPVNAAVAEQETGIYHRRTLAWFSPIFDAAATLTTRPARALILCLAFALAATGLVVSSGMMSSAANQVSERLDAAAFDEVRVIPSGSSFTSQDSSNILQRLSALEGVQSSGYRATLDAQVTRTGEEFASHKGKTGIYVLTADAGYLKSTDTSVSPENAIDLFELAGKNTKEFQGGVALVGRNVADKLGVVAPGEGVTIAVQGHQLSVIGIIDDSSRDRLLADSVVVDLPFAQSFSITDHQFFLRTLPGYPAPIAEVAPLAADPGNPQNFTVQTVTDLRSLSRGVSDDVATLSFISSWAILFMATLSAGTTMYMSVQTRRGEIALRRAVGSSSMSILRLFLAEGFFVGVAGGALGTAVGTLGIVVVCYMNNWEPVISSSDLSLGIIAGSLSGLLSAILPAIIASRAQPAEAIRN